MVHPFELASGAFANAHDFKVRIEKIPSFPPVDELAKETGQWYPLLESDDESWAQALRLRIWRLRNTAIYSVLPFDDPELDLTAQLESLADICQYIPTLHDRIKRISAIVEFLVEVKDNPKRQILLNVLEHAEDQGAGLGILVATHRGQIPGWSNKLFSEIRSIAPACSFIVSARVLHSTDLRSILALGSTRSCPFARDLFHSFRSSEVRLLLYSSERFWTPERPQLPAGTWALGDARTDREVDESDIGRREDGDDDWLVSKFWESMRRSGSLPTHEAAAPADRVFTLPARLVLLANDSYLFLQDDSKVIEISGLVEGSHQPGHIGKRFPRRRVSELREGDLIVLRTSGSGDYLIDVADALMSSEGKQALRGQALDWKPVLKSALEEHGVLEIASRLKKKGLSVSSPSYLWMWSTNLVIRPASEDMFFELMAILDDLGYSLGDQNLLQNIETRWSQMLEIIRYHRLAGLRIRNALLKQLRRLLKDGIVISSELHLTLPGVDGGEMSVFRVAAIDTEVVKVPYQQVGVLTPVGD